MNSLFLYPELHYYELLHEEGWWCFRCPECGRERWLTNDGFETVKAGDEKAWHRLYKDVAITTEIKEAKDD